MIVDRFFFVPGANDAKMNADRIVFAPGATEKFTDWRERCKTKCRPKLFLHLARPNVFATVANDAKMKLELSFFCAWRERCKNERRPKFLRLVRPNLF